MRRSMLYATVAAVVALASPAGLLAGEGHGEKQGQKGPVRLEGEVVDLMCYLDHGAKGKSHKDCAEKCIRMGGPVGLLVKRDQLPGQGEKGHEQGEKGHKHGKKGEKHGEKKGDHGKGEYAAVLVIGDHAPANEMLVDYAAQTITLEGKFKKRSGMMMLENVRLVESEDSK